MMMKLLPLILSAFIVQLGSTYVHSQEHKTDRLQKLFDSIARNNTKGNELYREILKRDVAVERQDFNALKRKLWIGQNSGASRKTNLYRSNSGGNIVARKREVIVGNSSTNSEYVSRMIDFGKRAPRIQRVLAVNGTRTEGKRQDDMYFFPSNTTEHLLNASSDLLRSQQRHFERMTKEFNTINKHSNILDLKKVDAALFSIEIVLKAEMKKLKTKFENPDALTSEEKVDPIQEVTMVCLISAWTQILNLISKMKLEDRTEGIEEQIQMMKQIIDIATAELRLYEHIQEQRLEKLSKTTTLPPEE